MQGGRAPHTVPRAAASALAMPAWSVAFQEWLPSPRGSSSTPRPSGGNAWATPRTAATPRSARGAPQLKHTEPRIEPPDMTPRYEVPRLMASSTSPRSVLESVPALPSSRRLWATPHAATSARGGPGGGGGGSTHRSALSSARGTSPRAPRSVRVPNLGCPLALTIMRDEQLSTFSRATEEALLTSRSFSLGSARTHRIGSSLSALGSAHTDISRLGEREVAGAAPKAYTYDPSGWFPSQQLVALADLKARSACEQSSPFVGQIRKGTRLLVLEVRRNDEGVQRAHVMPEGLESPLGWVTLRLTTGELLARLLPSAGVEGAQGVEGVEGAQEVEGDGVGLLSIGTGAAAHATAHAANANADADAAADAAAEIAMSSALTPRTSTPQMPPPWLPSPRFPTPRLSTPRLSTPRMTTPRFGLGLRLQATPRSGRAAPRGDPSVATAEHVEVEIGPQTKQATMRARWHAAKAALRMQHAPLSAWLQGAHQAAQTTEATEEATPRKPRSPRGRRWGFYGRHPWVTGEAAAPEAAGEGDDAAQAGPPAAAAAKAKASGAGGKASGAPSGPQRRKDNPALYELLLSEEQLNEIVDKWQQKAADADAKARAVPVDFQRTLGLAVRAVGSTKQEVLDFIDNWDKAHAGCAHEDGRPGCCALHQAQKMPCPACSTLACPAAQQTALRISAKHTHASERRFSRCDLAGSRKQTSDARCVPTTRPGFASLRATPTSTPPLKASQRAASPR